MSTFSDILDYIRKAEKGRLTPCTTTQRTYWRLYEEAVKAWVNEAVDQLEHNQRAGVRDFLEKEHAGEGLDSSIQICHEFWRGYAHGLQSNEIDMEGNTDYDNGFHAAQKKRF